MTNRWLKANGEVEYIVRERNEQRTGWRQTINTSNPFDALVAFQKAREDRGRIGMVRIHARVWNGYGDYYQDWELTKRLAEYSLDFGMSVEQINEARAALGM